MIINGINAEAVFGICLAEGAFRELWKQPVAKRGYEKDWPDRNGIETDPLETPVYERLDYSVPLLLVAESQADYWTKLNAFLAFCYQNRYIILDIPERYRRFRLVNRGFANYEEYLESGDPNAGLIWNLSNDHPTENFIIE